MVSNRLRLIGGKPNSMSAQAQLRELPSIDECRSRWQLLQDKITNIEFQRSWVWIGSWLKALDGSSSCPLWLEVRDGQKLLALGILIRNDSRLHHVIKSRHLSLHATGNDSEDIITIEYNNLLCTADNRDRVWKAIIELLASRGDFDELIIPGIVRSEAEALIEQWPFSSHIFAEAGSWRVDLDAVRDRRGDNIDAYLAGLSRNCQRQIRRSMRAYGDLAIERAQNPQQAMAMLEEANIFHRQRWRKGAMDYPFFARFNELLINEYWHQNLMEVMRINARTRTIGWLYNFLHDGHVYFYLGAFRYEDDNRLRPGLVSHALCIADHLQAGHSIYDFMAGDARYKSSLGLAGPDIVHLSLRRPRWFFAVEERLRHIKRRAKTLIRG